MSRVPILKKVSPREFTLFRVTTRAKRPSLRELDSAILIVDTLLGRLNNSHAFSSVWDVLSSLKLPPSQESWLRALFMDVAGASPAPREPRSREPEFRRYLTRVLRELKSLHRDFCKREAAQSPFSVLERLF